VIYEPLDKHASAAEPLGKHASAAEPVVRQTEKNAGQEPKLMESPNETGGPNY
jgi:hypothetical protein